MHIDFVEFREELTGAVADFNRRLVDGGQSLLFPAAPVPEWLPKLPGRKLFQEYCLATDAGGQVRGGYMLKHQEFRSATGHCSIGDFQLPISEGVVNRAYAALGAASAARRRTASAPALQPGNGLAARVAAAVAERPPAGRLAPVPFFFRIVHPFPVPPQQRLPAPQRPDAVLARRARLLGTGVGGHQAHPCRRLAGGRARLRRPPARSSMNSPSGPTRCGRLASSTTACAPSGTWRRCKSFTPATTPASSACGSNAADRTIGWAVLLNNKWWNHRHFGRMRLGSIADCFAAPADAAEVVRCATRFLQQRGVDLIVSNQSHAAWRKAFRASGFLPRPIQFQLRLVADA